MKYLLEKFGMVERRIYLESYFLKMKTYPKKGMYIQFQQGKNFCLFFRRKGNLNFIGLLTPAIFYL